MTYTITIDTTSRQAQGILNMLKALSIDYDFLQIHEDTSDDFSEITTEQKQELESRYEYVLENPTVGKPWNEVKQNLLSK